VPGQPGSNGIRDTTTLGSPIGEMYSTTASLLSRATFLQGLGRLGDVALA
jgi:hypothetical protein